MWRNKQCQHSNFTAHIYWYILSLEPDSATGLQELLRSAKAIRNSTAVFPKFLAQCVYDGCILWHVDMCLHLTLEMVGAGGRRLHYQRPAESNEVCNQASGTPCSVSSFQKNLVCCRKIRNRKLLLWRNRHIHDLPFPLSLGLVQS